MKKCEFCEGAAVKLSAQHVTGAAAGFKKSNRNPLGYFGPDIEEDGIEDGGPHPNRGFSPRYTRNFGMDEEV
jgi:hypothetical protein